MCFDKGDEGMLLSDWQLLCFEIGENIEIYITFGWNLIPAILNLFHNAVGSWNI